MERIIHVLLFSGLCLFIPRIWCKHVLIQELKTWDEAQVYCRHNHFDLVTIQSDEDRTDVQQAIQPALTSAVWIGLYNNITSWRWSYKNEDISFSGWQNTQPDNRDGKQECVVTVNGNVFTGWHDISCLNVFPFFCYNEKETLTDRFVLINVHMTWPEAQSFCRRNFTDLAIIRNISENDLLLRLMALKSVNVAWIGLFRDSWKWSDGTNVNTSAIKWLTGQPNMIGQQKRPCGFLKPEGLMDDEACSNTLPFICLQKTKKQMVRLELVSDVNVNDAVVIENISESLNKKLKDHGIQSDPTVTWRVQSDGNVFTPKQKLEENLKEHCSEF